MKRVRHINPHPDYLPRGLEIDGWRIIKRLASGGFGVVYLVEMDGVQAALKIARVRAADFPEDAGRTEERTLRELVCLLRINHPNVVRVLAHKRWPNPLTGFVYFVMEYVEGDTLKAWARRNAPTVREAVGLFAKLADALEAAHRLGILHRDLKPANVLVRRDGAPKLLDFGAGDFPQADPLTGQSLPPGTITHRSPEAVRFERENEKNEAARYEYQPTDDLYSLGATFYEVLTGRAPFALEPGPFGPKKLALAIEMQEPPAPHTLNPHVPPALSNLVMRLLSKKPTARHASAEAVRRDLTSLDAPGAALDVPLRAPGAFEGPGEESAQPTPPVPTPATVVRSRRLRWAVEVLALVGVVGLLVLLALFLTHKEGAPSRAPAPPLETARTEPRSPLPKPPATPPGPVTEAAPMLNASPQQEGPTVKTPAPQKSPPASPPAATPKKAPAAASLKETCRVLVVGSSAWLAAGCAGVQVRPPSAECPQEARRAMRELGWENRMGKVPPAYLDAKQGEGPGTDEGVFPVGVPIVSKTAISRGKAPEGTLLYGRLWLDEKKRGVWGRWTEAELPEGRKVPVCLELGVPGTPYPLGRNFAKRGEQPGTVVLPWHTPLYPVNEWTDAEKYEPRENRP
jgi:serine/threonine-protein kinase